VSIVTGENCNRKLSHFCAMSKDLRNQKTFL